MTPDQSLASNEPSSPAVEHVRIDTGSRPAHESSSSQPSPNPKETSRTKLIERYCLIILATLAILYTLYFARAILLPSALAVILSLVLKPLTKPLDRLGVPGMVSAAIVLGLFTIAIGLGGRALWIPANDWIAEAPRSIQKVRKQLGAISGPIAKLQQARSEVENMDTDEGPISDDPIEVQVKQPPLTNDLLSTTGSFGTAVTITLSLLFFLLASGDRFLEKAVQVKKTWREKRDVVLLVKDIEANISTYLGSITVINIGLGVVIGLGLWAIEMPNPLLWGVLAALLNYIPFAGLIIGTSIVSIVAIAEFSSLGHALLAPAIYLAANGIEANIITPAILGRSVSLNPVVILMAVFIGGWIWGVGGIFLAVPILLMLKIVCDSNEALAPIGVFLAR